jgi:hypothetical protein
MAEVCLSLRDLVWQAHASAGFEIASGAGRYPHSATGRRGFPAVEKVDAT